MAEYSNPELLVSTDWVAEHIDDPSVVIVESNEDIFTLRDRTHTKCRKGRLAKRTSGPADQGLCK